MYIPFKCHPLVWFTAFIALVFFVTYLDVKGFIYRYNSYTYSGPGDVAVDDVVADLSTFLCSSYNVTPFTRADVFLVPGRAQIDFRNRTYEMRQAFQLFPGDFLPRNAFYLLEGSEIKLRACIETGSFKQDINVLLFKGEDSWTDWTNGGCYNCPAARTNINANCSSGNVTMFQYTVQERDTYFVSITRGDNPSIKTLNVGGLLEVNRTTFDTSYSLTSCRNTTNCLLDLDYLSDVDIVIAFDDTNVISFGTQCELRTMAWVGLFIFLPCAIVSWGAIFYLLACKRRGKKQTTSEGLSLNTDRNKLITCELSTEYRSTWNVEKA